MDQKMKDGSKFWSLQRITPTSIMFDPKEKMHLDFIISYSNLISKVFDISPQSNENIINILSGLKYPSFYQKRFKFATSNCYINKEIILNNEVLTFDNKNKLENLTNSIEGMMKNFNDNKKNLNITELIQDVFDKQKLSATAIEFINTSANLRSKNFKIKEVSIFY